MTRTASEADEPTHGVKFSVHQWKDFDERMTAAHNALRAQIDFGVPAYVWTAADDRPIRVLGWDGDDLVAHAGLLAREVRVADVTIPVVGLCSVMVRPDRQRAGVGAAIVTAAFAEATRRWASISYAAFVCLESRVRFYERLGAHRIAEPVTVDQPSGVITVDIPTMWRSLRSDATWPDGAAHLVGLPW